MIIVELLKQAVVAVLVGYLSFTNFLANQIDSLLIGDEEQVEITTEKESVEQTKPTTSTLSRLPSKYGAGGAIPKILLENADYQRAAVLSGRGVKEKLTLPANVTLSEYIEGALVNIVCRYRTDTYIKTTTGTGSIIDRRGIILTNAHVAQFLLLEGVDEKVHDAECIIRTGNPAEVKYKAKLLYLSPMWIKENAALISEEHPTGTGERDYALLYINESIDSTPLPAFFSYLPIDTDLLTRNTSGTEVITAGYPAEAFFTSGSDVALVPKTASTTVGELYTFGSNYADVFSVSGSPVGEQGSSGGPIVKEDGSVMGLIVTKGDETREGKGSLHALSLSYIDRTMIEETGFSVFDNTQGDLALRGKIFNDILGSFLANLLTNEI